MLRNPADILDEDRRDMLEDNLHELLDKIQIEDTDLLEILKKEHKIDGKSFRVLRDKDVDMINVSLKEKYNLFLE